MTRQKALGSYRRIVIKIGSALLVDRKTGLKKSWLDAMCADIAKLKNKGVDVLVVSSGAIALGRSVLDLPSGALKLEESQAAAAVGQIALARDWSESLSRDRIVAGQLSQCARHDQPASEDRRRSDHQRERHRRYQRNPLWRQ
jgi:glutamate 5-kinase